MSKKAKQFGVNKQSKRRAKRKQRAHAREPDAIVPRSHAAVVYQLFENRTETPVTVAPSLKRFMV